MSGRSFSSHSSYSSNPRRTSVQDGSGGGGATGGGPGGKGSWSQGYPGQNQHQRRGSSSNPKGGGGPSGTNSPKMPHSTPHGPPVDNRPGTPQNVNGSPAGAQIPRDLSNLLGIPLRVTLIASGSIAERSYSGSLWCYDPLMGCLALECEVANTSPPSLNGDSGTNSPVPGAGQTAGGFLAAPGGSSPTASTTSWADATSEALSQSRKRDYRIIKLNQIKALEFLATPPSSSTTTSAPGNDSQAHTPAAISSAFANSSTGTFPVPNIKPISLTTVAGNEKAAVKQEEFKKSRLGPPGVSKEGQQLFDALAKTMPVRWANMSIVVLDEVIINPPYAPSDCKANAKDAQRLDRVRKVVEGEQSRFAKPSMPVAAAA